MANEELPLPEDIQIESLSPARPEIWNQTLERVQEMQAGKLPEDVAAEIQRRAAESAAYRGFGVGNMGTNLSLRDLGVSSLSQIEKGITLGMEMGRIEGDWNMTEAQTEQQRQLSQIEARQKQQQINQAWLESVETLKLGSSELAVKSAQALAANREARLTAETNLLQLNAQLGLDVQAYLDAIGGANGLGYFEESDIVLGEIASQYV